jgi:exonuclease V gamma subunit
VEGLQAWQLRQRLIRASLSGRPLAVGVLAAEGLLPHGELASLSIERLQDDVDGMLGTVADYRKRSPETLNVALLLPDGMPVQGQVQQYYDGLGLLSITPSSLKGDQLLQRWLDHLAACAAGYLREDEVTLHVVRDRTVRFAALAPDQALEGMQRLVALYREGMQRPLPVSRQGSHAAARKISADEADRARDAARSLWSNPWGESDGDDVYLQAIVRAGACPPHEAQDFEEVAWRLYSDVAAALPKGKLP